MHVSFGDMIEGERIRDGLPVVVSVFRNVPSKTHTQIVRWPTLVIKDDRCVFKYEQQCCLQVDTSVYFFSFLSGDKISVTTAIPKERKCREASSYSRSWNGVTGKQEKDKLIRGDLHPVPQPTLLRLYTKRVLAMQS